MAVVVDVGRNSTHTAPAPLLPMPCRMRYDGFGAENMDDSRTGEPFGDLDGLVSLCGFEPSRDRATSEGDDVRDSGAGFPWRNGGTGSGVGIGEPGADDVDR